MPDAYLRTNVIEVSNLLLDDSISIRSHDEDVGNHYFAERKLTTYGNFAHKSNQNIFSVLKIIQMAFYLFVTIQIHKNGECNHCSLNSSMRFNGEHEPCVKNHKRRLRIISTGLILFHGFLQVKIFLLDKTYTSVDLH